VSPDTLAAFGAFLSGASSVVTAAWYVRRQRAQAKADCEERLAAYDKALHEGVRIAREQRDEVH
jgi:hypothetical protein